MSRHPVERLAPGPLTLAGDVAHHLRHVLRARAGQTITLFDADGRQATAVITTVGKDTVEVAVGAVETVDRESPIDIALAFALSKGSKPEWIVRKAVELGVNELVVFPSARSVTRWKEDEIERKLHRLRDTVRAAAAQCGRNRLPSIRYDASTQEAAAGLAERPLRLVSAPEADRPLLALLTCRAARRAALLTGPEGGLTGEEIEMLLAAGWQPASLGPRILRAETATLAAVALLQGALGDLGAAQKRNYPTDPDS